MNKMKTFAELFESENLENLKTLRAGDPLFFAPNTKVKELIWKPVKREEIEVLVDAKKINADQCVFDRWVSPHQFSSTPSHESWKETEENFYAHVYSNMGKGRTRKISLTHFVSTNPVSSDIQNLKYAVSFWLMDKVNFPEDVIFEVQGSRVAIEGFRLILGRSSTGASGNFYSSHKAAETAKRQITDSISNSIEHIFLKACKKPAEPRDFEIEKNSLFIEMDRIMKEIDQKSFEKFLEEKRGKIGGEKFNF